MYKYHGLSIKKISAISAVCFCLLRGTAYCEDSQIRALTWRDVLIEAFDKNPSLKKAQESVNSARYDYLKSYDTFLPQVNADASAAKSGADAAGESNAYSYGVTGSISLFSGFKDLSSLRITEARLKISKATYMRALSDAVFDLKKSFIELLWSQETVVLDGKILKQRDDNLELVRLKYESGTEDKGSLDRVEADKVQAEYDLARAKRHAEAAAIDLQRAIGTGGYDVITVTGDFGTSGNYGDPRETLDKFFGDSYRYVPEYQIAEYNFSISELEKKSSIGDFYPALSLSASDSKTGSGWAPGDNGWNIGLRLSYPLFTGGDRYFNLKTADSNLLIAEESLRETKNELISKYESALNDFYDAYENINVSRKYFDASQEQALIITTKYINGLAAYQDWYIVEGDFINSQKALLDARKSAVTAEAALKNIVGQGD